ncbi:OmpA family protein [Granulicella arctica]|uniref:OmpA family protein n=1 Tax=Granulicella arctica TaxID=940613 RepID=UPI0021DFE377|nr:OmpA family protein [Granulicella arctica]
MADRVKIYEEKKGFPIWAWLLPLLLLALLAAYFLTHHKDEPAAVSAVPAQSTPVAALPDLGTVHFDTDKATLTSEGQATLQQAATAMKANPNAHLRLEGFTDSSGTLPHNATLSQQRTMAVADFLKGQGIDGSRLTGQGFGPAKPVDTNATASGEADNRRVELFSQQ